MGGQFTNESRFKHGAPDTVGSKGPSAKVANSTHDGFRPESNLSLFISTLVERFSRLGNPKDRCGCSYCIPRFRACEVSPDFRGIGAEVKEVWGSYAKVSANHCCGL